ncbi:FmdB family zinc ribbon protein [Mycobacterium sp. 1274756.6]|uniref:FmdB family zinc ribbon protein n=1 Tax=Mycobacterium sp. 1274756.6 TaxID=1834076 RepID=UPI0007FC04F5|nr:FmdB family zinc ribbon protein [Mycobacterium sp. 1274756.6]OBJ67963.1 FmdB family transcriptional regulator [Mycobacterium sp. 1274756.6]
MPTYSYQCTDCGDRFDVVQAFTDDTLTTCAKCSGRLRKLFGSVGVVFKGSGFYRTDSRAGNGSSIPGGKKSNGADGSSGAASGEKSSGEKSSGDKPGSNGSATKSASSSAASSTTG